jgi:hypothetical protein
MLLPIELPIAASLVVSGRPAAARFEPADSELGHGSAPGRPGSGGKAIDFSGPRYLDVFGQDPEQDKDDPEISTMFARPL